MSYPQIPLSHYLVVALLLVAAGCSSSTSTSTNNGQTTVTMQSQLTTSDVSRMATVKGATPSGVLFDSLVVTQALVFVKDVKLHSDVDDTTKDDHDATVKTGPFVIVFDSSGTHVVTTATIPSGTYDRVKFEIHKPDKNNTDDAAVLASYPQLQVGNQTYSVYIYGYTVRAGLRTAFMVHSSASRNGMFRFQDHDFTDRDNVQFVSNGSMTLNFQLDPRVIFHLLGGITGTVFDPNDATHQN